MYLKPTGFDEEFYNSGSKVGSLKRLGCEQYCCYATERGIRVLVPRAEEWNPGTCKHS